jgi:DegV family protein with EDD domain
MENFALITDSASDLTKEIVNDLDIKCIGLVCNFQGREIEEDFGKTLPYKDFYDAVRNGAQPTTAQINTYRFREEFEAYVKQGISILYVSLSSALSGTCNGAMIARNELLEEYPDADISVVDSSAASMGEGLLVYKAALLRKEGKTKDEVANWVEENKNKFCSFFTVDDINHLKRGGRVSATAAAVGSLLNIKPVLYINDLGQLIPSTKARGMKKAIKNLFDYFEAALTEVSLKDIFIAHSDNLEGAIILADMIKEKYPDSNIKMNYIGSVVGSHTGAGTIALFFMGKQKEPLI